MFLILNSNIFYTTYRLLDPIRSITLKKFDNFFTHYGHMDIQFNLNYHPSQALSLNNKLIVAKDVNGK